jgi:hypothetical protein
MPGYQGKLGFIDDAAKRLQDSLAVLRDRPARVEEGLRERAAKVELGLRERAGNVQAGLRERMAGVGSAEAATNPDLTAVQASIRNVMAYVRENPVPAALIALGAGVIATSMWNEQSGRSGRRSRRRR